MRDKVCQFLLRVTHAGRKTCLVDFRRVGRSDGRYSRMRIRTHDEYHDGQSGTGKKPETIGPLAAISHSIPAAESSTRPSRKSFRVLFGDFKQALDVFLTVVKIWRKTNLM